MHDKRNIQIIKHFEWIVTVTYLFISSDWLFSFSVAKRKSLQGPPCEVRMRPPHELRKESRTPGGWSPTELVEGSLFDVWTMAIGHCEILGTL